MILELDLGNTRIKWRLLGEPVNGARQRGVVSGFQELLQQLDGITVSRVRAASVRRGQALAELSQQVHQVWNLQLEVARVARHCGGVSVAYTDLDRLGVDRWLTLLAAYRDRPAAAVIVDCGTALTVDLLDDDGRHRGGYIVPGLQLAARALTENTGIRLEQQPVWSLGPGNSSEEAVYHGALAMLVGLIETVTARRIPELAIGAAPRLYLTGGDSVLIGQNLDSLTVPVLQVTDLVLDGLAVALP